MQYRALLICLPLLAAAGQATEAEVPGRNAAWQTHEVSFFYSGRTTLYTCDGLEDQVRRILEFFGARSKPTVRVHGCAFGPFAPNSMLSVDLKFESLAEDAAGRPVNMGNGPGRRVNGRYVPNVEQPVVESTWQEFRFGPRSPATMGAGECELVEAMRKVLREHFSLRALEYRTTCFPHHIGGNDYSVRGQVLRPARVTGK